jgi:hypothetical protein
VKPEIVDIPKSLVAEPDNWIQITIIYINFPTENGQTEEHKKVITLVPRAPDGKFRMVTVELEDDKIPETNPTYVRLSLTDDGFIMNGSSWPDINLDKIEDTHTQASYWPKLQKLIHTLNDYRKIITADNVNHFQWESAAHSISIPLSLFLTHGEAEGSNPN